MVSRTEEILQPFKIICSLFFHTDIHVRNLGVILVSLHSLIACIQASNSNFYLNISNNSLLFLPTDTT